MYREVKVVYREVMLKFDKNRNTFDKNMKFTISILLSLSIIV